MIDRGARVKSIIGTCGSSISELELTKTSLYSNTLILAEEGSGKTNLSAKIRQHVIDNNVPTLYMDFSNPLNDEVESRFRDENFNYMKFEETDAFDEMLTQAVKERKHVYLAIDPAFFSNMKEVKSKISIMLSSSELLGNYYYFFHEIAQLNAFYTKFEDFLRYIFDLISMQKYGLTFLTQPHEIFEDPKLKLLFTYLYLGRCSNANYFNTSILKNMKRNVFLHQYRQNHRSLLFNEIKNDIVTIGE